MKLVNIKLPKRSAEQTMKGMAATPGDYAPEYPWGTRLDLDTETLKQLGLKVGDFDVNQTVTITAKASVTSLSSNVSKSETRDRVELQITDLAVEAGTLKDAIKSAMNKSRGGDDDDEDE